MRLWRDVLREQAKLAATSTVTSLYGLPVQAPGTEDSLSRGSLTASSSPALDEQRVRSAIRQQFEGLLRRDQAGSSREPDPGLPRY